jgi:hypothetical protein
MPDWREVARRKLTPLALDAKREEEIVILPFVLAFKG